MISFSQLQTELNRALEGLSPNEAISVRSWKGDRGFLVRIGKDGYEIIEDGYENRRFICASKAKTIKECRRIGRREFPRSHRLRFSVLKDKDKDHG